MHIPPIDQVFIGYSMERAFGHDIIQMVIHAGLMVKCVLLVLLIFSITSWAIILMKIRLLKKAREETEEFLELFWETLDMKEIYRASEELHYSPVARLFRAGYAEFGKIRRIQSSPTGSEPSLGIKDDTTQRTRVIMDNLERSLRKAMVDQVSRLESALNFLATTGNTAPFIGLFGTVWGIMQSFRGIGLRGSASLAVVAPGISEALIATAAGLAAAIPAVVAFNYFNNRVSDLSAEMEIFSSDFLSLMERRLFRGQVAAK
ncbi:MAG: protein TolQ [Deltaproteobacteria bacterium]|nr:MAG: protein TolQ [Deltaproteobacteria bacterium]RLB22884.1 MAG: protein TolQ [Deltaproteobacteria bacterium]